MSVTYDDEPGPEGFERVSRDLAKGGTSGRKAFLWLKRHAQQRPSTTLASQTPSSDNLDGMQGGAPTAAAGDDIDVMPIGEVVVAFGSADPNAEEAAEIAEQDRVAVATDRGWGQEGGAGERRAVRVWERLDRSLSPPAADVMEDGDGHEQQLQQQGSGLPAFLWFRRVSEEEPLSWSAHSLTVRAVGERRTDGMEWNGGRIDEK